MFENIWFIGLSICHFHSVDYCADKSYVRIRERVKPVYTGSLYKMPRERLL